MPHILSLGGFLYILWLLLSGYFTSSLLLGLGAASTLAVIVIARRMDVIDREGHPIDLGPRAALYMPWLGVQIIKSSLHVSAVILQPVMAIRPRMVAIKAGQKTPVGRVIHANSITLTPGTVAIGLEDKNLRVHALTKKTADDLLGGATDRRVSAIEGGIERGKEIP